jgi:hypothetical protein
MPDIDAEVESLLSIVRARYGERLTPEQLAGVRQNIEASVTAAHALRAVRLHNADEPAAPFVPYRTES